jgi:hypothetical protein
MATTEPTLIPNRWLSVSRYVGPRLEHCRYRGRAISLSLRLRGCGAGCTNRTSVARSELSQIDRSRRRGGCAGTPLHKICTASLDNLPLIDGFARFVRCWSVRGEVIATTDFTLKRSNFSITRGNDAGRRAGVALNKSSLARSGVPHTAPPAAYAGGAAAAFLAHVSSACRAISPAKRGTRPAPRTRSWR